MSWWALLNPPANLILLGEVSECSHRFQGLGHGHLWQSSSCLPVINPLIACFWGLSWAFFLHLSIPCPHCPANQLADLVSLPGPLPLPTCPVACFLYLSGFGQILLFEVSWPPAVGWLLLPCHFVSSFSFRQGTLFILFHLIFLCLPPSLLSWILWRCGVYGESLNGVGHRWNSVYVWGINKWQSSANHENKSLFLMAVLPPFCFMS